MEELKKENEELRNALAKAHKVLGQISDQWDEKNLDPDFFLIDYELMELVADLGEILRERKEGADR